MFTKSFDCLFNRVSSGKAFEVVGGDKQHRILPSGSARAGLHACSRFEKSHLKDQQEMSESTLLWEVVVHSNWDTFRL